jgi:regulator of protease activity HflC (stomatin/prohibitin superfamily)
MGLGFRGAIAIIVAIIVAGAFIVVNTAITIEAGTEGVYDWFGTVEATPLQPGFHIVNPLASVHPFSLKQQSYEYQKIEGTLTKEGLSVTPDVSILYRIQPGASPGIYKNVSGNYFDTLITPIFMSVLRDEIKRWSAEDIYTGKASEIQADVQNRLQTHPTLVKEGIVIDQVLIRGVVLPPEVVKAVENKIKMVQEVETTRASVLVQEQTNLKIISASKAQAQANQILSASITPTLVNMKLAEAYATNPNVVFAGGANNLLFNPDSFIKNG